MTAYNGEKYIGEQIDSILSSSYQDFELFICDDGSTDRTMSILQTYEKQNPDKLHIVQNTQNLGVTLNFLTALSGTTMDYVMFCDQDDVWKPNKIAITLKRMRHMEAQIGKNVPLAVFTDANIVDQNLNIINNSFFSSNHLNPRKTDLPHILMENKLIGCTVMMNAALRKVLQSSSLPAKAKYHDWWIALIAASFGKIGYLNECTLLYRQHESNVVGGADFYTYVKRRLSAFNDQKEAIRILIRQAEEFLALYGDRLPEEKREIIRKFVDLEQLGFVKKRRLLLQEGYLKTGLIRNTGLLIII
jgi:glycosyltransferase involved in cell wall biosynthesis